MCLQKEAGKLPPVAVVPAGHDLADLNNRVGEVGDAIQHHAGIGVVNSDGKKDWHDWEAIAREEQRQGECTGCRELIHNF